MNKKIKLFLLFLSVLTLVFFVLFLVNQTYQVVKLAETLNPFFGQVVLYTLLFIYFVCLLLPTLMILRLPKTLTIPTSGEGSIKYNIYIKKIRERYSRNRLVPDNEFNLLNDIEYIKEANKCLKTYADEIIKSRATKTFIATAVSQSGRLDGIVVLINLITMVHSLSKLYFQRPNIIDLIKLYNSVFIATFVAAEIEDSDVIEGQVEPIIASVFGGSFASLFPGVSTISNFALSSIVQGSANAFLTLRVGCITKQYCSSVTTPQRSLIRRSATMEASVLLSSVVKTSAVTVTKIIYKSATKVTKKMISIKPGFFMRKKDEISNQMADEAVATSERSEQKKGSFFSRFKFNKN